MLYIATLFPIAFFIAHRLYQHGMFVQPAIKVWNKSVDICVMLMYCNFSPSGKIQTVVPTDTICYNVERLDRVFGETGSGYQEY
jgi:hypothetical protein